MSAVTETTSNSSANFSLFRITFAVFFDLYDRWFAAAGDPALCPSGAGIWQYRGWRGGRDPVPRHRSDPGYAGRLADQYGAKRSVLQGMLACALAGAAWLAAALLPLPVLARLGLLLLGRLILGFGESQLLTGNLSWGWAWWDRPVPAK